MAVPNHDDADQKPLAGERIALVGKLAGMTRREAVELVTARGAELFADESNSATLVVIGDSQPDLVSALASDKSASRQLADDVAEGRATLLREAELWKRIGLVDEEQGVQRLYTPAMLADLLDVPARAVRRWHRSGVLVACRNVRRLPYFDFTEVAVARHLAELFQAGCSLRVIDRKLAELARVMPEVPRPLADPTVVVEGRRLFLRRGDDLTEPGGQVLIDFDKPTEPDDEAHLLLSIDRSETADETASEGQGLSTLEHLRQTALEWEDQGELQQAVEAYRTLLVAGGPAAEVNFALADLLYRMGDLPAARERFYAAVELDEEYVEARANLGCVLAENNELELSVAAFQGALAFHPDYADVHYHIANSFDRLDQHAEAELHWHSFLALAPESPWADTARARLSQTGDSPLSVLTPAQ
jgi:tetratricopeptide (TPR) repeat protein